MDELSLEEIKKKLLALSAKGAISKTAISKTATHIKKINENNARVELEKYEQKIAQKTVDKIKNVILDGFSKTLHYLDVIDEEDKKVLKKSCVQTLIYKMKSYLFQKPLRRGYHMLDLH